MPHAKLPTLANPAERPEFLLALIVTLTGAALAAFLITSILVNRQLVDFQTIASETRHRLQSAMAANTQILGTVTAIHQAAESDRAYRQFSIYAQGAIESNPAIQALGRFDRIDREQALEFEEVLQRHGIHPQEKILVRDGAGIAPPLAQNRLNPIVNVHPPGSPLYSMIGLDLESSELLQRKLDRATSENRPLIVNTPANWQLPQQTLLLLQPTYTGHYAPPHPIDRLDQADGGYWLAVDIDQVLKSSLNGYPQISATLSAAPVDTALFDSNTMAAASIGASSQPDLHFSEWFPPFTIRHDIPLQAGTMTLLLSTTAGISEASLSLVLATFSVAILFFSLAFFLRSLRRNSELQIEHRERALIRERERAQVTLHSIGDGVITTDADGYVNYYNPAADDIVAGHGALLLSRKLSEVLIFSTGSTESPDSQYRLNTDSDRSESSKGAFLSIQNQPLPTTVVDTILSPLTDASGDRVGSVLALRNVTTEHTLSKELDYQAKHDKLTRLANRATFERVLARLIADARMPTGQQHTLCYIDLDQFKLINDTCSHAAGDLLLTRLARELSSLVRNGDLLARLGGDEFGVLITNCANLQAEALANQLHEFFQDYEFAYEDKVFRIHASIGLVHINGQHKSVNEALSEVDLACYHAKDSGRNTLHVYDPGDEKTRQRYGEMLSMPVLHQALRDNNFMLFAQPIASTEKKDSGFVIHHHEILLRLLGDNGEVVAPFRFILAAERYDMMRSIDRWVVAAALERIAGLQGTTMRDDIFSINLSGQTMVDCTVSEFITRQVMKFGVNPRQLCFEITETSVIGNFDQALALIHDLKSMGCSIALDDFGAGVSSFGYLKKLPVDYLKIDGQFVREMAQSQIDHEMVQSIHNVGRTLNIKTVAEFVESEDIMEALREMGIDYAQGYHISKPMPIEQLEDYAQQLPRAA